MFGLDLDPLSDNAPPRYAYESDDEDENVAYPVVSAQDEPQKPEIKVSLGGQSQPENLQVLLIASGDAGAIWASGAALGEQIGEVSVNEFEIGLVFRPSWLGHSVIVSEVLNRLPVCMMHDYAETILEKWKPSRLILLDSYSTPIYAANKLIPHHEAPVRYLQTGISNKEQAQILSSLEPFSPPNLLQSTTAAFLAITALPNSHTEFALSVLVPSPKTPRPSPQILITREETHLHPEDWDSSVMIQAHNTICAAAGCKSQEWVEDKGSIAAVRSKRKAILVEENMYI